MGLLRRLFGPAGALKPSAAPAPVVRDGFAHAPDADSDDVVVPKRRSRGRTLLGGAPAVGWQASRRDPGAGIWSWSSDDRDGGSSGGGDGGDGSGGSSGDGG